MLSSDHRVHFILDLNRALLFFVFRTISKRGRFVQYPSYAQMTGYHIFNNFLVKYHEQNYYLLKILHIEYNFKVEFCFVLKAFFPVVDSVSSVFLVLIKSYNYAAASENTFFFKRNADVEWCINKQENCLKCANIGT